MWSLSHRFISLPNNVSPLLLGCCYSIALVPPQMYHPHYICLFVATIKLSCHPHHYVIIAIQLLNPCCCCCHRASIAMMFCLQHFAVMLSSPLSCSHCASLWMLMSSCCAALAVLKIPPCFWCHSATLATTISLFATLVIASGLWSLSHH